MTTPAVTLPSYDLFSPEAQSDPMPLLHRVRAESPVCWVPELGAYLVTRHADVVAALRDQRLISGNLTQGLDQLSPAEQAELMPMRKSVELWMGHTNEEDHVRFQHLLKRYFTPAMVNGLRPRVREFTNELLDAAAEAGKMDVVEDLAYPLPANIIAEMLGMPISDRERLQAWSRDILSIFLIADVDKLRVSQRSVLEMQDYLRVLVADRRKDPRDDLLTMFVEAERDGKVNEDEIVANCLLLLFAGHETTANLIANGLVLLFENPDQLALLKSRPELMPSAVEEMMRCDGPAGMISRVSAEPVEIAGHAFPAGERFYLGLNASNRDPEVFADPDRFDITRKPNHHMGFSMGATYCLGAALARVETGECLLTVLERYPDIRADYETPDWSPVMPLGHHLDSLAVRF
jgi:cytochrome P450